MLLFHRRTLAEGFFLSFGEKSIPNESANDVTIVADYGDLCGEGAALGYRRRCPLVIVLDLGLPSSVQILDSFKWTVETRRQRPSEKVGWPLL